MRLSLAWDRETEQHTSDLLQKGIFPFFLSYSRCSVPQATPSVLENDKSECLVLVLGLLIKEISPTDPF